MRERLRLIWFVWRLLRQFGGRPLDRWECTIAGGNHIIGEKAGWLEREVNRTYTITLTLNGGATYTAAPGFESYLTSDPCSGAA